MRFSEEFVETFCPELSSNWTLIILGVESANDWDVMYNNDEETMPPWIRCYSDDWHWHQNHRGCMEYFGKMMQLLKRSLFRHLASNALLCKNIATTTASAASSNFWPAARCTREKSMLPNHSTCKCGFVRGICIFGKRLQPEFKLLRRMIGWMHNRTTPPRIIAV